MTPAQRRRAVDRFVEGESIMAIAIDSLSRSSRLEIEQAIRERMNQLAKKAKARR